MLDRETYLKTIREKGDAMKAAREAEAEARRQIRLRELDRRKAERKTEVAAMAAARKENTLRFEARKAEISSKRLARQREIEKEIAVRHQTALAAKTRMVADIEKLADGDDAAAVDLRVLRLQFVQIGPCGEANNDLVGRFNLALHKIRMLKQHARTERAGLLAE